MPDNTINIANGVIIKVVRGEVSVEVKGNAKVMVMPPSTEVKVTKTNKTAKKKRRVICLFSPKLND